MFFGNAYILTLFERLIAENRLSHAYLFFGPSGVGKHTFARLLARKLECADAEKPLIDACFIEPSEGSIGIDAVRAVKQFLFQTPLVSPKRTVVIDDAHVLTWQAQPAFLKIMEEPPPHALLILIAPEQTVLIPPLLSRLTKIYFGNCPKKEIEEALVRRAVEREKAREIAARSFGRIGIALQMIQEKQTAPHEKGEPRKVKKKKKESEENLEQILESRITELFLKDPVKNAPTLSALLKKEEAVKRFNLNQKLQAKAVSILSGG